MMRLGLLVGLVLLPWLAVAQAPTPAPKKSPFEGFGNSALDRRPGGPATPSPFLKPAAPAPEIRTETNAESSAGIALAKGWADMITQGAGGQTMKLDDLRALLSDYGTAEADTAAHPEVTVYEGPTLLPNSTTPCRITYLMTLEKAEKILQIDHSMASHSKAVAPGFPDGLFLHTYSIKAGIYNRLTIVTDTAKPLQQVVSLLLKNETESWHPVHFHEIVRDWHTSDYVNAKNRGQPRIAINTRVNDRRRDGGYLVINSAYGVPPPIPAQWVRVAYRPSETSTWYVPVPLVKLILFTLSKQWGRQG